MTSISANQKLRNANVMRMVEEEFGSLKRQLERRERQRLGLPVTLTEVHEDKGEIATPSSPAAPASPATLSPQVLPLEAHAAHASPVTRGAAMDRTQPAVMQSLSSYDMFPGASGALPVVQDAHRRHNIAVATHITTFREGQRKVEGLVEAAAGASEALEGYISRVKEAHAMDVPAVDSSVMSNYGPIRDVLRKQTKGTGAGDDDTGDDDQGIWEEFAALTQSAALSPRETVLLKRVKDLSQKLKALSVQFAESQDALKASKADHTTYVSDMRDQHAEVLRELREEMEAVRTALQDDIAQWESATAKLQQRLAAQNEAFQAERTSLLEAHAAERSKSAEDIQQWMQTVAQLDREKHQLTLRNQQEHEQLLRTTEALSASEVSRAQFEGKLAETTSQLTQLHTAHETLRQHYDAALKELSLLKAQRPATTEAAIQVEYDSVLSNMMAQLDELKRDHIRLKQENETQRKRLTTAQAEVSGAELMRKQFNAIQNQVVELEQELGETRRRQQRDWKRRIELIGINFLLRVQLVQLMRPHGVGSRLEELAVENRWLHQALERKAPLKVLANPTAGQRQTTENSADMSESIDVPNTVLNGIDVASDRRRPPSAAVVLVDRLADEVVQVGDRDVIVYVSHAATQTQSTDITGSGDRLSATSASTSPMRELDAAAASVYATEGSFSVRLASHLENSDAYHALTGRCSSKSISQAAARLQQALRTSSSQRPASASELRPLRQSAAAGPGNPSMAEAVAGDAVERPVKRATSATLRRRAPTASCESGLGEGLSASGASGTPSPAQKDFFVVGHRDDAACSSAIGGAPSQYFRLRRQHGMSAAQEKRMTAELRATEAIVKVRIAPQLSEDPSDSNTNNTVTTWLPTQYAPATTFPIRSAATGPLPMEAMWPHMKAPGGAWVASALR